VTRQQWQEEASAIGGRALVEKIDSIVSHMKSISCDINATSQSTEQNKVMVSAVLVDLADLKGRMSIVLSAFPDGDIEGHRRYHLTQMELLVEKRRLRQAIQEKTISGLVWVGIVGFGVAFLNQLKIWLR